MTCPICGKPGDDAYRPFCSRRCADVDLGRWLTGGYVLPGPGDDAEADPDPRPKLPAQRPH
jgi:endogenous inhibitor of DNA gyrase (YacG/DUF329 family)